MIRLLCLLCLLPALMRAAPFVELPVPTSGDGAGGDFFGVQLYADEQWLFVGAYGDVINSVENFAGLQSGTVKVYQRGVDEWEATQVLSPPGATPSTLFGDEIRRLGDRLAISAPRFGSSANGQEGGAVFLYRLQQGQWVHERTVVPLDSGPFGRFGESIVLFDAQLWVGAPQRGAAGEVFLFDLNTAAQTPEVILPGPSGGARFGEAMTSIDATTLAVGAPGAALLQLRSSAAPYMVLDTLSGPPSFATNVVATTQALVVAARDSGAGRVFRWLRGSEGWVPQPELMPADGMPGDRFGGSLLIAQDRLYIGAPGTDRSADFDVGAVYQAPLDGADPLLARTIPALNVSALFGSALAVDVASGQILVGAPLTSIGNQRSGQVLSYASGALGAVSAMPTSALDRGAGAQLFRYAQSVAVSGDSVLAGAFLADTAVGQDAGAAFAFRFDGNEWLADGQLQPADAIADQRLGLAVDVSGDVALVGAYWDVIANRPEQGSAYFFRRTPTGWVQQAKVFAANGAVRDNFGAAVAIDGGLAAVGARGANPSLIDQGTVNVYRRAGEQWLDLLQLTAPQPEGSQFYGQAVALCGDRLVVGAPGADGGPELFDSGLAFVYDLPTAGDPVLRATLQSDQVLENRNFGFAVACAGSVVAIGVPGGGSLPFAGQVEVFDCGAQGCTRTDVLTMAGARAGDQLGIAVSMHGSRLLAGISGRDVDGLFDVGAAVLFERAQQTWSLRQMIAAPKTIALGGFGRALDIDARRMVIGSPTAAGQNPAEGSMWVFDLPGELLRDGFEAPSR